MIKLMIVDDHAMFRDGLRNQFESIEDITLIGEAESAATLLPQLDKAKPGVMTLDIKLPDSSGTALIPKIKAALPRCKIVILTMFNHTRYAAHALEQGADGFVVKGAPFVELLAAIRTVAAGKTYVSQEMANNLAAHIYKHKHNTKTPLELLSKREFEVLIHLSRGISAKDTANILKLSQKTVGTYKTRLMQKLSLNNQNDLIRFAIEFGLQK